MDLNVGICQLRVTADKSLNLQNVKRLIAEAAISGADIIVLPEMFNCPYQQDTFSNYAEAEESSETLQLLATLALKHHCYLVGGSIPERDQSQIYNTAYIFNRFGQIIAKHRKVHLFDIDVPGKIEFKESAVLSAGDKVTLFETEFGKFGVLICYDLRFPEMFRLMAEAGAVGVFIPGAFNMTTGPAHWEVLMRARAIDNQQFIIGVSPARDETVSYVAYGNSIAVNPWGEVLWKAGAEETVQIVKLNLEEVDEVRERLPLLKHRRTDLYKVERLKNGQ